MELSRKTKGCIKEYDACNMLDELVLNFLFGNEKVCLDKIVGMVKKKINVNSQTIDMSLFSYGYQRLRK